jgi:hypothetical protein
MVTAAVDPGVGFDFDFFPFMETLREAAGGGLAAALVVSVVLLALAAVMWGVGKIAGARSMQSVGFGAFCVTGVVAVLIGAANGIAVWGSNLDTGF